MTRPRQRGLAVCLHNRLRARTARGYHRIPAVYPCRRSTGQLGVEI